MKTATLTYIATVFTGLALIVNGCTTSSENLQAQAKIPRAQAEQMALAQVPGGSIREGELEKEHGKLVWSFDIATAGTKDITEIHVDALTGQIVARETETPKQQVSEARSNGK